MKVKNVLYIAYLSIATAGAIVNLVTQCKRLNGVIKEEKIKNNRKNCIDVEGTE